MAEAIKTRIQLKNDTEENWNKATNFVPKQGELIIYSADESHPFSRIKIGDGETTVINLPFIDAKTMFSYARRKGATVKLKQVLQKYAAFLMETR